MNKTKTRDMVITALLTALSILIPMVFTAPPFRIPIGTAFTATLTAHVPIMIAMFISPWSAAFVAIGSAIGFIFSAPLIIAARASTHIIFAMVGAYMILKMQSGTILKLITVWFVTMILHAGFEAIVTIPMMIYLGSPIPYVEGYTVGFGTLIHHTIDYAIMLIVLSALSKAKFIDWKFKKPSL